MVGGTFQESKTSAVRTSGYGYVSDALLEDEQAASQLRITSTSSQYKYDAVFSRMGYDWMDKYILNLTARRDGTSRFGAGKQFGDFGALGAAWIFTKEESIQRNLGFLSFGKLRASYGTTGSDQIPDYQYPEQRISRRKLSHMGLAAEQFLIRHNCNRRFQLDAISVTIEKKIPKYYFMEDILPEI
jgi:TonB-dependent starch-binding outer membrane protein SusC